MRSDSAMKREASRAQGREIAARLQLAEDELRLVVAHVGGLSLRRSGNLVAIIRRLQQLRLEVEVEAERIEARRAG